MPPHPRGYQNKTKQTPAGEESKQPVTLNSTRARALSCHSLSTRKLTRSPLTAHTHSIQLALLFILVFIKKFDAIIAWLRFFGACFDRAAGHLQRRNLPRLACFGFVTYCDAVLMSFSKFGYALARSLCNSWNLSARTVTASSGTAQFGKAIDPDR